MSDANADPAAAPPRLHDARLVLRGWRDADLDAFYALYSDPRAMRYWSFAPYTELAQAHAHFERARDGIDPQRSLSWAIATRHGDRVLGSANLFAIDRAQGRAEIGYLLGSAQWGRGYAHDALALVLRHAFAAMQLRRIEADVDPRNEASCRLLERLGFRREGLLRERWQVNGELQDSALYGRLASDTGVRSR